MRRYRSSRRPMHSITSTVGIQIPFKSHSHCRFQLPTGACCHRFVMGKSLSLQIYVFPHNVTHKQGCSTVAFDHFLRTVVTVSVIGRHQLKAALSFCDLKTFDGRYQSYVLMMVSNTKKLWFINSFVDKLLFMVSCS
ncbi:uncharacterized protein LOC120071751 [Benincasa hispida]|uniref:uncharacterized protein LOC120071751 n=1 Tax=Benincasa hispida TaxID=102211 RepID=UPI0018FFA22D|nr:uncharacterized protein LOC120071751 [Benincasa hispida]